MKADNLDKKSPWEEKLKQWLKSTKFYRKNRLILREFKHFWKPFTLGFLLSVASSLLEAGSITFLAIFLRSISGSADRTIKSGIPLIDNLILGVNDPMQVQMIRICALIIVATFFRCGFMYLGNLNLIRAQIKLLEKIRLRIYDRLASLHLSFFIKERSGSLVSTMTAEVENLKNGTQAVATIISKGVYVPIYLFLLTLISIQLSTIAIIFLVLIPVALIHVRKKTQAASLEAVRANQLVSSLTVEFISGIQTIQAFSSQNFEKRRFEIASKQVSLALGRQSVWQCLAEPTSEFIGFGAIVVLLLLGNIKLNIPASTLLAFLYVLLRLIQASRQTNLSIVHLGLLHGSLKSIESFLDAKDKLSISYGSLAFDGLKREIRIDNVYFGYDPERLTLKGVNIVIPKGKTYALVGSSGSGKSTLVSLLLRLYDPTHGAILIDGEDIRNFDLASLHKKMALVSQDTFLFNASVRDNIAYGLDGVSEADLRAAAKLAYALEFIEALPNGFDTLLGDRGVRLSGGQRQRIAIARAILRDPDILILDEATSALDNESERIVQQAIAEASRDRTVILVAHRLSTVANADKIVVLNKGEVAEVGNYKELLDMRGIFYELDQIGIR